jgi:VTC domain-containing protein
MRTVGLEQVVATANLQTRVDRKYLVSADVFERFATLTAERFAVLEMQDLHLFRYESVYFDTRALAAYRQHAHDRRRRFKVRTRTYLDSGECVLEVKMRGGRGETVKSRRPYDCDDRARLTEPARGFVSELIPDSGTVQQLEAVITTAYRRATLLDLSAGSRLTCDVGLSFTSSSRAVCDDGARISRNGPEDLVLVESKTIGAMATADSVLWRLGQRPVALSKYCIGMALVRPDLPANRWNRELRRYFGWMPEPAVDGAPARMVQSGTQQ